MIGRDRGLEINTVSALPAVWNGLKAEDGVDVSSAGNEWE